MNTILGTLLSLILIGMTLFFVITLMKNIKYTKSIDKQVAALRKLAAGGKLGTKNVDCIINEAKKENLVGFIVGTLCSQDKEGICETLQPADWNSTMKKCGIYV